MPETSASSNPLPQSTWRQIIGLLRPHWKTMSLALAAVVGETASDLLEPWPLVIIINSLVQSKPLKPWLAQIVNFVAGQDKFAILNFALGAVAVIAIVGAVGSYAEKYLTS